MWGSIRICITPEEIAGAPFQILKSVVMKPTALHGVHWSRPEHRLDQYKASGSREEPGFPAT